MVLPPAGPPPPTVPEGWKAHWNAEYKAWFYENIYTEEAVWEKPTQPVYPPQAKAPLPPGPPPGYSAVQQPAAVDVKSVDPTSLPMAAVSISDPYSQAPSQQPAYAPAQQPPTPQQLYTATPPPASAARVPSPQPGVPGPNPGEATRDYPGAPQYSPQPAYAGYPPQQPGPPQPRYPQQQPGYPPQPNYAQQPQYAQPPPQAQAPAPPAKGGFMGMLQNKLPGGKVGTAALGVGGGLLAGALLEHEWDEHKEHERRRHHGGGFGGFGSLMKGFGGPPVVENITINEDNTTYVDDDTFNF